MATEIAKQSILCSLTADWQQRTIEAPRSRGNIIKFRFAVVAAKHEWTLSEEREGAIPITHVHAARFADMAPMFQSVTQLDPVVCLQLVADGLEKITGKKITFVKRGSGANLWIDMGHQIDEFYKVNYAIDDGIKAKLFGSDEDDEDE